MASPIEPPKACLVKNLPFERDGGKDTVERALAVGGHQHQVLPALVDVPNLALGGEAEPGDDEVEVGLAEAVRHGTARREDDRVAVGRVGGEEGRGRAAPAGRGERRGAGTRRGRHGEAGGATGGRWEGREESFGRAREAEGGRRRGGRHGNGLAVGGCGFCGGCVAAAGRGGCAARGLGERTAAECDGSEQDLILFETAG